MVDLESKKVLFATKGKDNTTLIKFVNDFKEHGGNPENISLITCDMSLGFKKGIMNNFPNSEAIIDKFHVIKHSNKALDNVRKIESKSNSELKGSKYLWLKNDENLTDRQHQRKQRIMLSSKHMKTSRAYAMKVELQEIYDECSDRAKRRLG